MKVKNYKVLRVKKAYKIKYLYHGRLDNRGFTVPRQGISHFRLLLQNAETVKNNDKKKSVHTYIV